AGAGIGGGCGGRVADGVDFGYLPGVAEKSDAGVEPDRRPGVKLAELVQVECVLQGLQGDTDADCLRLVRKGCEQHEVPVPRGLTEAAVGLLRAKVRDLAARWQQLAAGRSLVLPYRR